MAIYTCGYHGFNSMSASGSVDRSHLSDTEDSSSTDASPDCLMPGPYSFEPSECDSEGSSSTLTSSSDDVNSERFTDLSWFQMMITLKDSQMCHGFR